jgi:hypothetical protein
MAEQALGLTLNAVPMVLKHGDKVWDPVQHRYRKMRGRVAEEDRDLHDQRTMEEKGLVLRRRRDVNPDEEIVEVVRHKGEVLPRRPHRNDRRASSMDNRAIAAGAAGAGAGAMIPYRDRRSDDYYDSEGSVPPRSRVRAKSSSGRSRRRRGSSSSSSSSSSSLESSTEEEKKCKKIARKKWITAALASVATIHAASKVYSSIESHDKRIESVRQGTLSPEEAHKQQRSARWQDAAAIGIAALGIKGAVSEWNEVSSEHSHHKEMLQAREEHHKKRMERERRRRAKESGGYYKGRDGNWYYDGPQPQSSDSYRSGSVRGNYDDRKMIEDSHRERKMIEYDEDRGDRNRRAVSRARHDDY